MQRMNHGIYFAPISERDTVARDTKVSNATVRNDGRNPNKPRGRIVIPLLVGASPTRQTERQTMSIKINKCPKCGYIAPNALKRKHFYMFGCPNLCFSKLLQK